MKAAPRSHAIAPGIARIPFTAMIVAACGGPHVDAPPPAMAEDVESVPALPLSTLNVPVTYDLSPILEELESAVPYQWGDLDERIRLPANARMHVAFEAERSRFTALVRGDTARVSATIRYRGRGWYDPPVAPEISGSCGTSDRRDDRPRAVVTLSGRIRLMEDWSLEARTRVEGVAPVTTTARDACKVTMLQIDVTERVIAGARSLLETNTPLIDRAIGGLDVRSRFEEWWTLLRTPIQLGDSLWLVINPVAVRRGSIESDSLTLVANVGLSAAPRLVLGPRPVLGHRPLPPLDSGALGDGLHIMVEGVVDYDLASRMLTDALRGRTFRHEDHSVRIRQLRLSGIGGGRLALEVNFDGSATGRIWFVGRPQFDAEANEVFVPDLDYDVATSHVLVSGLDWLRHGEILDILREKARLPVADAIAEARRYLVDGLNRRLSQDVQLSGEVHSVRALGVHATRRAILLQAHAQASARLIVRSPAGAE